MKKHRFIPLLLAILAVSSLQARMQLVVGIEDLFREIDGNPDQIWVGLEYTTEYSLFDLFNPYFKGMAGLKTGDDYILATGLAFEWQPLDEMPDWMISLHSGPSYTNVGPPHSGARFNWTSEISIHYKYLMVGYSHTSNGGVYSPNSGLDLFLIGFTLP
ncbi:acyloxyacyl hydrolase [Puniceicoccales bacterium CK1056]|uniref:Acyloxyacyl hydrolase n=1 Tax=Oceanipulchritudo coccoides TaxID=2706888 RepID=A0A6B2M201_9BACT|nr:acyloxyacyl hydrolase [Oceanipulchritudo coccoides]NDV62406.1 acyloxyacyl hydrolase [Oceanipulchritudo coccoides]